MENVYDYVVIGSGFGGSVSAMRLSEKGYSVLVLEKGKRWKQEDFPESNWKAAKFLWFPKLKFFGFQQLTFFKRLFVLSGTGVGGGSLVYGNTLFMPPQAFYKNPVWAHLGDWETTLAPHYAEARRMLGVTKNPLLGAEDEALKKVATELNRESFYHSLDVGVYFGPTDKPTDPYFNGEGPLRTGCTACAGCMVGCRYNAKNTLDKNYLYFAEKKGTIIQAESYAWKIEYQDNIYKIYWKSTTSKKSGIILTRGLICSAGTLGTQDLLLKQKYKYQTLTKLSEKLGFGIRTNSEMLCGITDIPQKVNNGIAISSAFNADEHTHIEVVKYPEGSGLMARLAIPATGDAHPWIRPIKFLGNLLLNPFSYFKLLFKSKIENNTIILLVMQNIDTKMRMVFKKGILGGRITLEPNQDEKVPAFIPKGQEIMHHYARVTGGKPMNAATEVMFNMTTTAHILGGCPMGNDTQQGVVNPKMEVLGYPNFFILDGSIVPCNIGVNPSLTITALSEYALSFIPNKQDTVNE